MRRIVLITACGNKKEDHPAAAGKLYKSPRIRYLYRKSRELKIPFFILSAKYGLINSETVIEPYDEIMSEAKCRKFIKKIVNIISKFEVVLFYRGGARKSYLNCIRRALQKTEGKEFISFGYGNMGDINKLEQLIETARELTAPETQSS